MRNARQAFITLSRILQQRHSGAVVAGAPDWIDPVALDSIALMLPGAGAPVWELRLALRDGIPAHALPRTLALAQGELPLHCVRAAAARVQAVPLVERSAPPLERGTATCLVRDRLNPDRYYLITCGHVVAPSAVARWDEVVSVQVGGKSYEGKLREWQPTVGVGLPASTIDAALIEVDSTVVLALRESACDWLPQAVDDDIRRDRQVALQCAQGALPGMLKVHWSGRVSIPDGDDDPDYFLRDAIGYITREPTSPGDSGGPVWTEDDGLLGMHIGSVAPEGAFGANAVLGRIAPVLEWYNVKPFTRDDPASLGAADRPGVPPRLNLPPAGLLLDPEQNEVIVLAKTIWGEARGEGVDGMKAVACVVCNRLQRGHRGCHTAAAVCLSPKQFSCWNANDPSRRRLDRIDREPDAQYLQAFDIASQALAGGLPDITRGALHYVASTLRERPDWLAGKVPCAVIGRHEFYNDIR